MKTFILGSLLLHLLLFSWPCRADELEPKRWSHLPIDTNFIGIGYAYTEADITFDPILRIEDGQMKMHTWALKYIRTFELFEKTARIDFLQAYQEGRWHGLLQNVRKAISRSGWSDTFLRFAINLYGSPPLKSKEYDAYRAKTVVETIFGVGLSVQLPTGDYMDDKLINLGTNQFIFRPQFGVFHTRGKWSTEATGIVELCSDNNEFLNDNKLERDPLYIISGHLIYTFRPGVWAGVSAGYDYGGRSSLNGTRKDDRKQNLSWALSFGIPVTRQIGFKLVYFGTQTQEDTGVDSDTLTMGFTTSW